MAEATLNDVSNVIKEDGNKDREQLKGDSIRQFFQLRSSNKFLTSLTQAQLDSNEQIKKQFEQEQEALKRANDQTASNNTIKEDGHKTRKQFHVDFARQFFQVGNTNTLLTNLIQSQVAANDGLINLTQAEVDSNKQMKKQFEQEQEALRRANAKKTLGEPANDNDSRFKRMMIGLVDSYNGVKKLLNNIKKEVPNKATMFTLLFGGLAAAFAFFPKEVKEYLIDPLIDVINVFRDKESTTTLGFVVEKLKKGLGWIADNFGEEAAWIVGIGVAAKALQAFGLPTLGIGPGFGLALKAVGAFLTMPWVAGILGIAALLASAKLGLDKLRDLSIESETELSEKALREYEKAVKDENQPEIDRIVAQQSARLKRNQDTTLKGIESIEGPINEILKGNVKAAEVAAEQARKVKEIIRKVNAEGMGGLEASESDTRSDKSGSTDKAIREANIAIAQATKQIVLASTGGKTPDKDKEAEIYNLLKESIERNDVSEVKSVIDGIKETIPRFSMLSSRLDLLTSSIKEGQKSDKMMEELNFALRGVLPDNSNKALSPKELSPVELSKSQEKLKTMYAGFDEMDNNMRRPIVPVVAPTTNNNDNKKTINNVYYNVFTDSNLNPATGRYENGVLPSYM